MSKDTLLKENIDKAIRHTYKLLYKLKVQEENRVDNPSPYDEEDDPDDIVKTLRLNKKYKFQIYIIPISVGSCDLTYYICDNNDNPIDQYTVGYVGFLTLNHDIDEVATKGLTWLFGMYI